MFDHGESILLDCPKFAQHICMVSQHVLMYAQHRTGVFPVTSPSVVLVSMPMCQNMSSEDS